MNRPRSYGNLFSQYAFSCFHKSLIHPCFNFFTIIINDYNIHSFFKSGIKYGRCYGMIIFERPIPTESFVAMFGKYKIFPLAIACRRPKSLKLNQDENFNIKIRNKIGHSPAPLIIGKGNAP